MNQVVNDNSNLMMSQNFTKYFDLMRGESDRGSVLVAAALLDGILCELLKSKLAPSIDKKDELFGDYQPYSSFSARIDLAYRLGLIRPTIRKSCHLLRKIRNDFAHVTDIKGFDHETTQSRIRDLIRLNKSLTNALFDTMRNSLSAFDINLTSAAEITERLGFRLVLELLFATLATGITDAAKDIDGINPLVDEP
jgi:hypothetical protein